ncbi:hypothetical protein L2E82_36426 [Cichorium intybus]|uniref:Uncharacterized protein n=1 Tax=Cichorium intybus TaxID=13427 RepID=A0ACB9BRT1_CICIN|nr:hypothetical protein L2E82_36426 [Cichorium intybus]
MKSVLFSNSKFSSLECRSEEKLYIQGLLKAMVICNPIAIWEKTDPIAIQDAVADYLSIELKEKTKPARAERLHKYFKEKSDGERGCNS